MEKVLVTARDNAPRDNAILVTPPGIADVQVVQMAWYTQVVVRTMRTYLQGLVGFLLAGGTGFADAVGVPLPAHDFADLFVRSASLALAPAVISLLQNATEILAKLDRSAPETRA